MQAVVDGSEDRDVPVSLPPPPPLDGIERKVDDGSLFPPDLSMTQNPGPHLNPCRLRGVEMGTSGIRLPSFTQTRTGTDENSPHAPSRE